MNQLLFKELYHNNKIWKGRNTMVKTYRKTTTIQAEQFDGSDYMCKKYNIILNNNNYYLVGNKVATRIKIGDWVTSDKRRHPHVITNSIFKSNYVEAVEWASNSKRLSTSKNMGCRTNEW